MSVSKAVLEGEFAGSVVVSWALRACDFLPRGRCLGDLAREGEGHFFLLLLLTSATPLTSQPTPQSPLPPPQQLNELRDSLLQTFRAEFDAAAERKDEGEVSRYFRLWPGIGAEDEGLEAYGDFVVGLVKARSTAAGKRELSSHSSQLTPPASSPVYYLTNLTSLLESIAHIIDQHQPVVDKYYGTGRMRKVVGRLVAESDRVVKNLVEGWEEERRVGRLVSS